MRIMAQMIIFQMFTPSSHVEVVWYTYYGYNNKDQLEEFEGDIILRDD